MEKEGKRREQEKGGGKEKKGGEEVHHPAENTYLQEGMGPGIAYLEIDPTSSLEVLGEKELLSTLIFIELLILVLTT